MEVLVRHIEGADRPIHTIDGTVVTETQSVSQSEEVLLEYLVDSETTVRTTLQIPKGHTDFRVDSSDKIIRISVPAYPLYKGERVRMYDAQDFKGDKLGVVHLEGLQHLTADGIPTGKSWMVGGKNYHFREMPPK